MVYLMARLVPVVSHECVASQSLELQSQWEPFCKESDKEHLKVDPLPFRSCSWSRRGGPFCAQQNSIGT